MRDSFWKDRHNEHHIIRIISTFTRKGFLFENYLGVEGLSTGQRTVVSLNFIEQEFEQVTDEGELGLLVLGTLAKH